MALTTAGRGMCLCVVHSTFQIIHLKLKKVTHLSRSHFSNALFKGSLSCYSVSKIPSAASRMTVTTQLDKFGIFQSYR